MKGRHRGLNNNAFRLSPMTVIKEKNITFYIFPYVAISVLPIGHEVYNLDRQFHRHHNNAFSSSILALDVENKTIQNLIKFY